VYVGQNRMDWLVHVTTAATVRALAPELTRLVRLHSALCHPLPLHQRDSCATWAVVTCKGAIPTRCVIVTAAGDKPGVDMVSRVFAPAVGTPSPLLPPLSLALRCGRRGERGSCDGLGTLLPRAVLGGAGRGPTSGAWPCGPHPRGGASIAARWPRRDGRACAWHSSGGRSGCRPRLAVRRRCHGGPGQPARVIVPLPHTQTQTRAHAHTQDSTGAQCALTRGAPCKS
jgi:hypothetical protein